VHAPTRVHSNAAQVMPSSMLPNTWEVHPEPGVWIFGSSDGIGDTRNNTSRLLHVASGRSAARGTAVIPVSPLHGTHFVRFHIFEIENGFRLDHMPLGTIGVIDAMAPFDGDSGGRAWGMELCDGGWRHCSNAYRSAEQRGALTRLANAGAIVTLRIDCRTRALSVSIDDEVGVDDFVEMPVKLPHDVESLRPWVVSAFEGDGFELHSVEMSPRARWSPQTHGLFPIAARSLAMEVMIIGYQLAARLPRPEQGALCELFVSNVLPAVMDSTP